MDVITHLWNRPGPPENHGVGSSILPWATTNSSTYKIEAKANPLYRRVAEERGFHSLGRLEVAIPLP
jgi:hypothetical protein